MYHSIAGIAVQYIKKLEESYLDKLSKEFFINNNNYIQKLSHIKILLAIISEIIITCLVEHNYIHVHIKYIEI